MGLIDDDGVAPVRQGLHLVLNEAELVDGGDNDRHPGGQGPGELGGVGVDLLNDTALVLELIDGVLQLLIEHLAVGQHHDRVIDLAIPIVVQRGQPVGDPGNGVGLARARRVLRQEVRAGARHPGRRQQSPYAIPLVIAREDHRLLDPHLTGVGVLLLLGLQMQEPPHQVQQVAALPDFLPQVTGTVPGLHRRVAGAAVMSTIEGQKAGGGPIQAGGHPDLVRIQGEVNQGAGLEAEQGCMGVAVLPVLLLGGGRLLAGHRVLQLAGGDGQAVDEQRQVQLVVGLGVVAQLAHHAQAVLVVQVPDRRIQVVAGFEVRQQDLLAMELEAPAQHRQHTEGIQGLGKGLDEEIRKRRTMDRLEPGPGLGLGVHDEGEHIRRNQRPLHVEARVDGQGLVRVERRPAAGLIAAVQYQVLDDQAFKGVFGVGLHLASFVAALEGLCLPGGTGHSPRPNCLFRRRSVRQTRGSGENVAAGANAPARVSLAFHVTFKRFQPIRHA